MSAVLSWVDMMKNVDLSEPTEVKITLRLGLGPIHSLDEIAKELDISRTRAATGLLEAAIIDAVNKIRPMSADDYAIQEIEDEQERLQSYAEHLEESRRS